MSVIIGNHQQIETVNTQMGGSVINVDLEVDASGLNCPLPLLRLKKALMEVQSGNVVKIIATDPAAHLDIGVYVDQVEHELVQVLRQENLQVFFIRKK